jgi:mono/diheme cytochrome c family protein
MNTNRTKLFAIIFFAVPVLLVTLFKVTPARVATFGDDPAVDYKAKCAMCHSPKAEKFFDPTVADAELVQAILKGKKGEKPPYMPAFEAKGMTEDQAKALAAYMKSLRAPAN